MERQNYQNKKKKKQWLVFSVYYVYFRFALRSQHRSFYVSLSISENASIFCNIAFLAIDGYFFCFFPSFSFFYFNPGIFVRLYQIYNDSNI